MEFKYIGELERLKDNYYNLSFCLKLLEAQIKHFPNKPEFKELRRLMNLALHSLNNRVNEIEKLVDIGHETI